MHKGFLVAALFLVVAAATAVPWMLGPFGEDPGLRLGILVLGGAAWALALASAHTWKQDRSILWGILAAALALRLIALMGTPGTSDDVYRYVWEGALVLEGQSPYAMAPDAPGREDQRERWPELYGQINHPEVSAAYPPLTQGACALGVLAAGGSTRLDQPGGWRRAVMSLRVLFALSDLALLLPLALLLRRRGQPMTLMVAWAWCPLVVLESGGAPHFDALGVLLLMAALAAGLGGRWRTAALWLSAGALVKWLPLLAAPFIGRDAGRILKTGVLTVLGISSGFLWLFLLDGGIEGLFGGLGEYAFRWESFNLLFRWIEAPLREWLPLDEGWNDARRIARMIVMGLFGLGLVGLWWRRVDALRGSALLMALFVILTPTLHPWYLLWTVPFLAFWRSPAFLWLLAVAPLSYWPLGRWHREGVWIEPAWLWPALALPFLALLANEIAQHFRDRRQGQISSR